MFTEATPELFLEAYRHGIFPMAEHAEDLHYNFYAPEMRAQLSIPNLHIPKSLLKRVKQRPYEIKINTDFIGVIDACAESAKGRESTWINKPIRDCFIELHAQGFAHSVEAWDNNKLVGGLYGLAIGAVFCGESMFSRVTDASKICLVHLCARLQSGGFTTLDTQFVNDHLKQFAVFEIPQKDYEEKIKSEMNRQADFILEGKKAEKILESYFYDRKF